MNSIFEDSRPNFLLLFIFLLLFVALWFAYPHHLIMSDPWAYSQLGYKISTGSFLAEDPGNIFVHRLGPTLGAALFYSILGVSIVSTNLFPLVSAIIVLTVIWFALPSTFSRVFGLLLCALNIQFFQMSVNLYPDIITTAFVALSLLILAKRECIVELKYAPVVSVIAMLALFYAFLAKLSAYWVLPVWVGVFFLDLRNKKISIAKRFYLPCILTALVIGSTYLLYNFWAWGDALVRFTNVSAVVEAGLWSISGAESRVVLVERLTSGVFYFLLENYGIILVPAVLLANFVPRGVGVWLSYAILSTALFWFGTTSFTSYQPMPLVPRMILPSLPAWCIVLAYCLSRIRLPLVESSRTPAAILAVGLVAYSGYSFSGYTSSWQSLRVYEKEAISIVREDARANPEAKILVISLESRSPDSLKFYFGYEYPDNLRFVAAADIAENPRRLNLDGVSKVYIYQNMGMASFLNRAYGQPVYDLKPAIGDGQRLYDDGGITLDVRAPNQAVVQQ